MKVTLEYRNPTPSHCDVAIFVNGGLAGVLTLRQEEIKDFQQVVSHGCKTGINSFRSHGNRTPPGGTHEP